MATIEQASFTTFLTWNLQDIGLGKKIIPLPHKSLVEDGQSWILVRGDDWRELIQPIYDEHKKTPGNAILADLLLNHDPNQLLAASLKNPYLGITSANDQYGNPCVCVDKDLFCAVTKAAAIGAAKAEKIGAAADINPFAPLIRAMKQAEIVSEAVREFHKPGAAKISTGMSTGKKIAFIVIGMTVAAGLIAYNLISFGAIKSPFAPGEKNPEINSPDSNKNAPKKTQPKIQKPGSSVGTVSIDPHAGVLIIAKSIKFRQSGRAI